KLVISVHFQSFDNVTDTSQFTAVNYTIRPSLSCQHYSFDLRTLFIFHSYLSKYNATFSALVLT
ncbi:hypothetical protein BDR04DRAFT_1102818, partial [Suillus decipiens]